MAESEFASILEEEEQINPFRGQKLTKFPNVQHEIVKLCHDNPDISDYAISAILENKYNFKFTSPSVKSWRTNFLPKLLAEYALNPMGKKEEQFEPEEPSYTEYVKKYQKLLALVEEASTSVAQARKSRIKNNTDGVCTYIDQQIEKIYQDYIKIRIDLFEKLLKYVPKESQFKIVEEVLKECSIATVIAFKPLEKFSEEYKQAKEQFKEEMIKVENKLRDKYFIAI